MQVSILNRKKNIQISVDLESYSLTINNEHISYNDTKEIDILYFIMKSSPKIINYDELISKLSSERKIAFNPYSDKIQYIRKKKHSVQKIIFNSIGENIIMNVRSVGYKIDPLWDKIPHRQEKTIQEKKLIEAKMKIAYMMLGSDFHRVDHKGAIITLVQSSDILLKETTDFFNKIRIEILEKLNMNEHEFYYVQVNSILREIQSYASLSRHGGDIPEKVWKEIFIEELENHFHQLSELLNNYEELRPHNKVTSTFFTPNE